MNEKADLRSMLLPELQALLKELGQPAFRAQQLFGWLHAKRAASFSEMTNLPKPLREALTQSAVLSVAEPIKKLVSEADGTIKYLFGLSDGAVIEGVLMRYSYGNTACISTQVGCRMGCGFCASTIDGMERNLSAGEMLSQLYTMERDLGERISGVVLMGSGEPLDNYDAVLRFLNLVHDPEGMQLGHRHITLSTCGLIPQMDRLAEEGLQITLAISLHAPNDAIRKQLMPIAHKYSIEDLLEACRRYTKVTKRRITFEYALIDGVNDFSACARELAGRLRHMLCHVNLIPVNPVAERKYRETNRAKAAEFARILQEKGIETTIRRRLGDDIQAACGQLRRSHQMQQGIDTEG